MVFESGKRGVLKNFLKKSFRKIWRLQKNTLPLHHFRANKTARGQKQGGRMIKALLKNRKREPRGLIDREGKRAQSRNAFFEVLEQLNKFSFTSQEVIFQNNTFEIRAKI